MSKNIGVIGAGAWGTAMAQALARTGNSVEVWAMEQEVVDSINNEHVRFQIIRKSNCRYRY